MLLLGRALQKSRILWWQGLRLVKGKYEYEINISQIINPPKEEKLSRHHKLVELSLSIQISYLKGVLFTIGHIDMILKKTNNSSHSVW